MTTGSFSRNRPEKSATFPGLLPHGAFLWVQLAVAGLILSLFAGCETVSTPTPSAAPTPTPSVTGADQSEGNLPLKTGDVLKIAFPGVPSMDVTQPVRPDGRISLPMSGDVVAAGKSVDTLTKELLEVYADKLVSKEVTVSVVSSSYPVYVTGAVLRPGKITAERRISVFEAIMEAGGFDKAKADLRKVKVVRQENGQNHTFIVDVEKMFSTETSEPFFLKPFDTVYIPDRKVWF